MKIIEALKKIKDLSKKVDDLGDKIARHSAHVNFETPTYENQKEQVNEWIQSCSDVLKEILALRIAIQKTNLATDVTIELDGKNVTKTIAEWIHRRRDLAEKECQTWRKLTDKNIKEGKLKRSDGSEEEIKIIRCYDPATRDKYISIYSSEPSIIDGKLEIVNAVTDLMQ